MRLPICRCPSLLPIDAVVYVGHRPQDSRDGYVMTPVSPHRLTVITQFISSTTVWMYIQVTTVINAFGVGSLRALAGLGETVGKADDAAKLLVCVVHVHLNCKNNVINPGVTHLVHCKHDRVYDGQ